MGYGAMNGNFHERQSTRLGTASATGISGTLPVVLSIAGFDPSSGAGISADLKVFAAFGLYGMSCITALTVQSTVGVRAVEPVSPPTVAETLGMLSEDVRFSGIKVGMLATADICGVVGDFLDSLPGVPVVLDPVLQSSSGRELLDRAGVEQLRKRLLARVDWITPNLEELSVLTRRKVGKRNDVPAAAERLRELALESGSREINILVTGGHLETPEDYLLDAVGTGCWIPGERVETNATHGTGCALSSALLCGLVLGQGAVVAATLAKAYVTEALRAAYPVGRGKGPLNHLYGLGPVRP
jgi:hydroxymethylpyrimidine/phosphomethylpyrimidine kinase